MLDPYSNNYSYEKWLSSNRKYLKVYFEKRNITIDALDLPAELYSVLRYNNIRNLADVAFLSEAELRVLRFSDPKIAKNISRFCFSYLKDIRDELVRYVDDCGAIERSNLAKCGVSIEDAEIYLMDSNKKERFKKHLETYPTPVENIVLSTRTYNGIKRARINTLLDVFEYYPDRFTSIKKLGTTSAEELKKAVLEEAVKFYGDTDTYSDVASDVIGEVEEKSLMNSSEPGSIQQALNDPKYKEIVILFVEMFDVALDSMQLSVRSYYVLERAKLTTLSKILKKYPLNSSSISGLGAKSLSEIESVVERYLGNMNDRFLNYLKGNMEALFSDEYLCSEIMSLYESNAFAGYSFNDFRNAINENVSDERLKAIIGKLLEEKKLEYVDYRCYKVYQSFYTYLKEYCNLSISDERNISILQMFFDGITLEKIGQIIGVTRERVRQIANKELTKLRKQYLSAYNSQFFDEDFYAYFFKTYMVDKSCWFDFIGVDENTYNYLKRCYSRGKDNSLEKALADEKVPVSIKIRLIDYMQKDDIVIDGYNFSSKRPAIENYIISTYCIEDTKWDDFVVLYNTVLKRNKVPYNEDIYYTDKVVVSRMNRVAESNACLWKTGKTLRSYDINSADYNKLLDIIGIANYKNTGLSTLKWFNDYPELMEEYDIRDQYELHNLLRKIIPGGSYNNIQFERQPGIVFGEFDRDAVMYDLMASNAPITKEALADIVYELYGYDRGSCVANYFSCIENYYHNGVYSIDFKSISEEKADYLKTVLTEDFYYLTDVKKIYINLYPDADVQEINPRSLKMIGFQSFSNYILKNHSSLTEYFLYLLTKDEIFDYQTLRDRFTYVGMFVQTSYDLRKNYDLLLFDDGKAINFNRLKKLGITKQNIIDYCNNVIEFIGEGEFFTMHSLHEQGFSDVLEDLGFGDEFYEGILEVCPDIQYTQFSNTGLFFCGDSNKKVQRKDLLVTILNEYKSISLDDLKDLLLQDYGIRIGENFRLQDCIAGTNIYYDSIMERFYIDKNRYYDELN